MSGIIYQVIFRGLNNAENTQTALTFKNVISENYIHVPTHYITALKTLSDKYENIINFQNIDEIVVIGSNASPLIFNYYIVLLLIYRDSMRKEGFLIGNVKKVGDILIGIWPFTENIELWDSNHFIEKFDKILENSSNYEKIALIYS
jgi:hypothetical protein